MKDKVTPTQPTPAWFVRQFHNWVAETYRDAQDELDSARFALLSFTERINLTSQALEAAETWREGEPLPGVLSDFLQVHLTIARSEDTITYWRALYWHTRGKPGAVDFRDFQWVCEWRARFCEYLAVDSEVNALWEASPFDVTSLPVPSKASHK
jgi:hypothetical protein